MKFAQQVNWRYSPGTEKTAMEWSRTGSKYDGRTKDRRMHGIGKETIWTGSVITSDYINANKPLSMIN